uniref:Arginine and glutamate-rich protein 1 n=1 Tax=Timema poppense TaxID=170557 RepID=A0A7R9GV68_TIMPO|nr:unnamed protein product [Timema poppensis]
MGIRKKAKCFSGVNPAVIEKGQGVKLNPQKLPDVDNRLKKLFSDNWKRSHTESSSSSSDLSDEGTRTNHVRKRYNDRKMDEVERLAEMERQRRQRELEQKMVEEETAKRIEELVKKRVEEELEKRKEEIEAEVLRRVEEAKKIMEHQMMEEMERRRQLQLEEEKKREVRL